MKDYRDNFVDAFSKALSDGNKRLSEKYVDIVCSILETILKLLDEGKKPAYYFEQLQADCRVLLHECAESGKETSKLLFIKLLDNLYKLLFEYIRDSNILSLNEQNDQTNKISLYGHYFNILDSWNAYTFFTKILSDIDIKRLRGEVTISNLLYNMQITDFAFSIGRKQNKSEMRWNFDASILHIQQYMGWYLNRQLHNPDITAEEITGFAKSCIIDNDYLYSLTVDYEIMRVLARTFLIENIVYICGLITAGLTDTAKDVFLACLNSKDNRYHIESSYFGNSSDEFILPITVFCYLYYLGFWEDEKYVSSELRDKVRELVKELSNKYREIFTRQDHYHDVMQVFIDELRTEGNGKFFPRYIYSVMRRFDFRASKESSYTIVTGNMVKGFCLFSIALNNPLSYGFDWAGDSDHDILSYLDFIRDEKTTLEELAKFVDFSNVIGNTAMQWKIEKNTSKKTELKTEDSKKERGKDAEDKSQEETEKDRLIQVLFERIKFGITSRYKDEIKKEAVKAEQEYEQKREEIENSCKNLKKKIEDVVRERFGELIDVIYDISKECEDSDNSPIIHDSNDCNSDYDECITDAKPYHTVEIFEIHTPTDLVGDTLRSQVEVMAMNAYSNLLQEYISLLIKARCLKPAERAKNDKDYINFLNRNDFDLLFGARWFFMASDFDSAEEFNKKIEKYTQIIANGYSKGFRSAFIKKEKLHFYIRNLEVKISDERPYDYRALGNIELPFENEELRVFIANERKVITVQAEIRVEPGNASGVYIE